MMNKDNKFNILVVDDNPATRSLLQVTLKKAGFQVAAVENGRKAIEQFRETFFPIVVTDWMMPEVSGPELCQILRNEATKGYVYILFLTSNTSKESIIAGLKSGADDYLTKPFNLEELIARINTGIRILELEKSLRQANEEIRSLSFMDPLTGSYNRGYIKERLPLELKIAHRYKRNFSVILSDIDHFKKVNDTYGHQAGDTVLEIFVKHIKSSIRDVDWIARYGGEEFLIILPETDYKGVSILAERLRYSISQKQIQLSNNIISITASFGVTSFDPAFPVEITVENLISIC